MNIEECQHTHTIEKEGETWNDTMGKTHTIIYTKCSYCSKTIRVRQTGSDLPRVYMPPFPFGIKP